MSLLISYLIASIGFILYYNELIIYVINLTYQNFLWNPTNMNVKHDHKEEIQNFKLKTYNKAERLCLTLGFLFLPITILFSVFLILKKLKDRGHLGDDDKK